jgi:hypothetical protein
MISLTPTRLLILVVVALVVVIYAQYYSKYNNGYNITQTYLNKINLDLLYERNPIVIYDSIKTPKQLLKTLFKYSYISKNEYSITTPHVYQSKSKFSFIYHTGQNTEIVMVNLINPMYKKDFKEWKQNNKGITYSNTSFESTTVEFISIKLKPYQVFIIPSHWMLQIASSEEVYKIDLDDIFTYFYFKIIK